MMKGSIVVRNNEITGSIPELLTSLKQTFKGHKKKYQLLRNEILKAQYWRVEPDITNLFQKTKVDADGIRSIRLPHPSLLIEYEMPEDGPEPLTGDQVRCGRRMIKVDQMVDFGEEHITIVAFYYQDDPGIWMAVPFVGIPTRLIDDLDSWFTSAEGRSAWGVDYRKLAMATNYKEMDPAASATIVSELIEEIHFVLAFMQIVACSNVQTEVLSTHITGEPIVSTRRNAPYHKTYRRFVLSPQQKQYNKYTGEYEGTSKAPHWRKGHIRRQPTNAGIVRKWINPTFVGAGTANPTPVLVQA
jgi:hypothetical protein